MSGGVPAANNACSFSVPVAPCTYSTLRSGNWALNSCTCSSRRGVRVGPLSTAHWIVVPLRGVPAGATSAPAPPPA